MNAAQGTVGSDPVILATAGYDHTVRFWQAHSGICTRTVQHQDSVSCHGAGARGGSTWGGGVRCDTGLRCDTGGVPA